MINTHNFSLQYAYTVQQTGTCNENTRTYQMKILSWSNIKFFELIYKEMCSNKKESWEFRGLGIDVIRLAKNVQWRKKFALIWEIQRQTLEFCWEQNLVHVIGIEQAA